MRVVLELDIYKDFVATEQELIKALYKLLDAGSEVTATYVRVLEMEVETGRE